MWFFPTSFSYWGITSMGCHVHLARTPGRPFLCSRALGTSLVLGQLIWRDGMTWHRPSIDSVKFWGWLDQKSWIKTAPETGFPRRKSHLININVGFSLIVLCPFSCCHIIQIVSLFCGPAWRIISYNYIYICISYIYICKNEICILSCPTSSALVSEGFFCVLISPT